jgi:hypothetical protein
MKRWSCFGCQSVLEVLRVSQQTERKLLQKDATRPRCRPAVRPENLIGVGFSVDETCLAIATAADRP